MIKILFYAGVAVVNERTMTDPTNDGAIAGGIVAASLAVTLVLVLIIIFLCRRYAHAHLTYLILQIAISQQMKFRVPVVGSATQ